MLISVVPIGNSKGIRLPKTIIDQLNVSDKLDLEVENQQMILTPVHSTARKDWIESFQKMHQNENDRLLIEDFNEKKAFEWEW